MVRMVLTVVWLVISLVGSSQIPLIVTDYEQMVAARLSQAIEGNAGFRDIIEEYHDGDVKAYIAHHLESEDPTFRAEGEVLLENFAAELRLAREHEALHTGGIANDLYHIATRGQQEILAAAWDAYRPGFSYTANSMLFTLIAGLLLWALPLFIWMPISRVLR